MKNRLGWTGLLLASILMACGQAPQAEVAPPTPQIPPKPAPVAFKPTMLGAVTFDFDSVAKTATARFDKSMTRATSFLPKQISNLPSRSFKPKPQRRARTVF